MTNEQYLKNQGEETKAYIEKIKKLLESEVDENLLLALQLLDTGGIPAELLTHLYAIGITYSNYHIADTATELFEQNAPADLLEFTQHQWIFNDPLTSGENTIGDFLEATQNITHFDTPTLANLILKFGAVGGAYCLKYHTAPTLTVLQQLYRGESLLLNDFGLTKLPPEVGAITGIKYLGISGNQFTEIPDELQALVTLERIHFTDTPLSDISIQKLETFFPAAMANHYASSGRNAFQEKDYSLASKHMLKAIDLDSSQADYWNTQGVILGRLKKREEAIRFFDQALTLNPQDTLSYSNKAHMLHLLGREEESLIAANLGLKVYAQHVNVSHSWKPTLYFRKGQALFHLGRYDECHEAYNQCIQLNPAFGGAWFNKACAYARQANKTEMLSSLSKAIDLDSKFRQDAPEDPDFKVYWQDADFLALINHNPDHHE
ncbi:hypothetical protein BKI52_14135 [marine bacterium AO1-C]|nr:hypothetical protein BKI52_14135 [marine bacterium AO1-C]